MSVLSRMVRPAELSSDHPLKWSVGTGVQVWSMFAAAIEDDLPATERLLLADPSLVRAHWCYRTPLYFAVREGSLAVAGHLLDHGADPVGLAVDDSLVQVARDRGYAAMEQLLADRIECLHGASGRGEPVAAAIRARDLAAVKSLLDAAPDLLHAGDGRGNQPVHWAVMTRQPAIIDELLARGADINARRQDGARPIHLTNGDYHYRGWRDVPEGVESTPAGVLAHLLARGANIDMNTACHTGDIARVRELLAADPSLANKPGDYGSYYLGCGTPLRNAAARGHMDIVLLLLEHGADPNQPEEGIAPNGHALYSAVYNGHHDIARLLLERGAYPSPEVESSADAMSIALIHKDDRMADLLAEFGGARNVGLLAHYGDLRTAAAVFAANPKLADDPGALGSAGKHPAFVRLMLRYAPDLPKRISSAGFESVELTELLFRHGLDPNARNWLGATPLHEIARHGNVERAAMFLDRGAEIDARDGDLCSTPLGWAAKFGKLAMIEFLLGRGARPNLPDDPPWATPLAWARRRGYAEIETALLAGGAR